MAKRQEDSTTTLLGLRTAKQGGNGVMTKMKALRGVCYGLENIDVYRRRMLLGLYHLEALSSQFDREPYMPCLDKLARVRILCSR